MSNTKNIRRLFACLVIVLLLGGANILFYQFHVSQSAKKNYEVAEQGDAEEQYKLGKRYATGDGVEVSASEAVKWYRKAAEQGHAEAQYQMGRWYDGTLVINSNTEMHFEFCANEDEDDEEALKWYHKAAEQGHQDAKMWIKNHDLWAAEKGDAEAQYCLGLSYFDGQGVNKDKVKAAMWFHMAADQGDTNAKIMLKKLDE